MEKIIQLDFRLRILVFLTIRLRLHTKTTDSLRLRLCKPGDIAKELYMFIHNKNDILLQVKNFHLKFPDLL